ncbi:GNAT family N-acetyltransferase [Paenalcaligenes hominis]|uniref:GNAT family N-acetyltransferase n=1 Tax=Paenalcaligenes hominis TaxID=643674 RepID=UPI003525E4BB
MASKEKCVVGAWSDLKQDATAVRFEVFVQEQNVPAEIELDEFDPFCIHAVVYGSLGEPVATGRLLPNAHIGRMAVKASYRGQGLGGQVLMTLMQEAKKRGDSTVFLSAQLQALGFYKTFGFQPFGEIYQDANIDHRMMRCDV